LVKQVEYCDQLHRSKPYSPSSSSTDGKVLTADESRARTRAGADDNRSVVTKRALSNKAKLPVFKLVFVSISTYGHDTCVMTEISVSHIQAAEMDYRDEFTA